MAGNITNPTLKIQDIKIFIFPSEFIIIWSF